ncbi:MAG: hypothetical protein C0447_09650 [Methylobacterium sp.]|nr:hypothetical protein [Methylobacterium sp.]
MKRTIINADEQITSADLTQIGVNAVEMVTNIVGGAVGYPGHWSRITVSESSASVVTISAGQLFAGEKLYDIDGPTAVDLQSRLPVIETDLVWVALLLRGAILVDQAQVTTLIDVDAGETDLQLRDKTQRHSVSVVVQAGIAGPTPERPTVAANECVVAWVLLSGNGVEQISMYQPHRAKTLYEVEARLTIVEVRLAELAQSIASIRTDLNSVAAAQRQAVRQDVFQQLVRDVAAQRVATRVLELEPRAYKFDPALQTDAWNFGHSNWVARIDEGIRFEFTTFRDAQLALLNAADPLVTIRESVMLPKFTDVVKLEVTGGTLTLNISDTVHVEHTMIRREISRSAVEFGPIVTVCENQSGWGGLGDAARANATLTASGETFQVVGLAQNAVSATWNADPRSEGHKNYDVQSVSTSSWTEVYWEQVTEEFGLNGTMRGQTFLNSNLMVATGFDLNFKRIASTDQPVHLICYECDKTGAPMLDRIIARSELQRDEISLGRTRFPIRPSLLQPDRRYGIATITQGNYEIAAVDKNKFAQGSSWLRTDGAWVVPSTDIDWEFALIGAQFEATRTIVEFEPLTLAGGMTYVRLLAAGWAPSGVTEIEWQFQPLGQTVWKSVTPETAALLYGLPPLIRLRAIMTNTTDVGPAIVLDNKARGETGRTRGDLVAVMDPIPFGLSTTSVRADLNIDQWKDAEHTAVLKLEVGGTIYTHTSLTTTVDPLNAKKRRLSALFTVPATTSAALRIEGTKTGVDEFFGQDVLVTAL